ncbi:hypothetical protein M3P21_08780 [Ruegeria sp. 2012CJ41-6]|uniref:Uncharacterized protein n=1 Tax=Ruegeria spongiae TaxID=2942209 RepID=A0ABT0Q404_9RHOB|nr:hypothetical protein [Ruegeria spongiae]MCL6283624.1 hypothetical protein [Ruegeria spongiae]
MRVDLDKLCTEIRQFGGNAWRFFTPVDIGWESVMLRGVAISDREFVEVLKRFPDLPQEQEVVDELARRGIWLEGHEPTPEEPTVATNRVQDAAPEQPTYAMSDERRRQRDKAMRSMQRADELADRKRRRGR